MKPYKNLSGSSGVVAFETGSNFIKIKFRTSDEIYTYNYIKPGKQKVEIMKLLAAKGRGLSTFISRIIKHEFFEKK